MRPLGAALALAAILVSAPLIHSWASRTHYAIAAPKYPVDPGGACYWALLEEVSVPQPVRDNLNPTLMSYGAMAPDSWRYRTHQFNYEIVAFKDWMMVARDNLEAGAWDNASYLLGAASHYAEGVGTMSHYDYTREYFETVYGTELGYDMWHDLHDHEEEQVKYHLPRLREARANWEGRGISFRGALVVDGFRSLDNFLDNFYGLGLENNAILPGGYVDNWKRSVDPRLGGRLWAEWAGDFGDWFPDLPASGSRDCEITKSNLDSAALLVYNAWYRALRDGFIALNEDNEAVWPWPA